MAAPQLSPHLRRASRRVHSQEDLSKVENRANVQLYTAASIPAFRTLLLSALRLPPDAVLIPEAWSEEGGRADLSTRLGGPDGPEIARIECENHNEETGQTRRYQGRSNMRVILVLGAEIGGRDGVTWSIIDGIAAAADAALAAQPDPAAAQQRVHLSVLRACIARVLGLSGRSYPKRIDRESISDPWVRAAAAPLLLLSEHLVDADASAEGSCSIKLYGPAAAIQRRDPENPRSGRRKGVFLIQTRANEPGTIRLPGAHHLRANLTPAMHGWIETSWIPALRLVTGGMIGADGSGQVRVSRDADHAAIRAAFESLIATLTGLP